MCLISQKEIEYLEKFGMVDYENYRNEVIGDIYKRDINFVCWDVIRFSSFNDFGL